MRRAILSVIGAGLVLGVFAGAARAQEAAKASVIYDEAKQGDFGTVEPGGAAAFKVDAAGIYEVRGSGIDNVDDSDTFVFEVGGDKLFEFCLLADPAEFKKLRAIEADGTVKEIAFGSTNPKFGAQRNITMTGLKPGKYHVEMYFGPAGSMGDWTARIAVRSGDEPVADFCVAPPEPTAAEKMKGVDWPGAITIYHGHNWGEDAKFPIAIKEAGFGATGAAEWQIEECKKNGLRAYVFIWAHEAATIPQKHADNDTVLCYYLSDRIKPSQWASWASLERMAYKNDPRHPAVFTMYSLWGGMNEFPQIVKGRAMEYYQYHWDGNRAPHMHFAFLDQYRVAAANNGDIPIIRIVEVRPEDMRKTRQTFYTALAYGVRGFRTGGAIFDVNKRDDRGVPTPNAFGVELTSINKAVNAYSPIFKTARCKVVYHVAPLPPGTASPPEDSPLKIEGEELCVGLFNEPDNTGKLPDYFLVANRDAFKTRAGTVTLAGDFKVQRMDKETQKWADYPAESAGGVTKVKIELVDGSGDLFKIVK